jgi:chromosome segregation protein
MYNSREAKQGACRVEFRIGRHPGAVWKRTDFQIHTPRDPQWSGSPNLPGGTPQLEAARDDWADGFVAKCVDAGLDAIAITDHHDLCMIEYVQRAIDRLPNDASKPWLFPGMEVTCSDAVQCLVLFSRDSDRNLWRRLFGGHLQHILEPDANAATNPQAVHCGRDLGPFLASVSADKPLADFCIVLPHASNDGAHKSMFRDGFAPRFESLQFDGVYTDKAFSELKEMTVKKVHGKIQAWGTRRRGIIPTGDNRHQNFSRLGDRGCWVRLGEPTAEALRQAMLADVARIAYEAPSLPSHRIIELEISSLLTGPRFEMTLNDGFTALIGGRGSGKSSVLEYLRYALGRSAIDTLTDDENYRARDQKLIDETLKGGSVSVLLERDGVRERWTRSGDDRDFIDVDVAGSRSTRLTIDAAQQRFRARAFYQKQLSTLVTDSSRTAEQITGIAAAEFLEKRRLVEKDIESSKRAVQSAYADLVEKWVADAEAAQLDQTLADLRMRIETISSRIRDAGLSDEDQAILETFPNASLAARLLNEMGDAVTADIATVDELQSTLQSFDQNRWLDLQAQPQEVRILREAATAAEYVVTSAIATARAALEELRGVQIHAFRDFGEEFSEIERQHGDALARRTDATNLVGERERLNILLQQAAAARRRVETKISSSAHAEARLTQRLVELDTKVEALNSILSLAADKVSMMSDGILRAKVLLEELPRQYISAFSAICEGSRVRDVQTRCEERVREIASGSRGQTWRRVQDQILEIRKHQVLAGGPQAELGQATRQRVLDAVLSGLTEMQIRTVHDRITDATTTSFLTATTDAFISFEYKDGKEFIPFPQASPGQQASALLQLLLKQEAGTLIIDQPEDDLDNRIIMDIASLLQQTKRKRQLIFATHNPNFVVNGDADKIVVLAPGVDNALDDVTSRRISVSVDGAIETPAVSKAVTNTMEGGKAAFELRSRKYSFTA